MPLRYSSYDALVKDAESSAPKIHGFPAPRLADTLETIFSNGKAKVLIDDESAFILLRRAVSVFEAITKTQAYKADKAQFGKSRKTCEAALTLLDSIKERLRKQYTLPAAKQPAADDDDIEALLASMPSVPASNPLPPNTPLLPIDNADKYAQAFGSSFLPPAGTTAAHTGPPHAPLSSTPPTSSPIVPPSTQTLPLPSSSSSLLPDLGNLAGSEPVVDTTRISTSELFKLFKSSTRVLAIDVRPVDDYRRSCLKPLFGDCTTINVAPDVLRPGVSSNSVAASLPQRWRSTFESRANYDLVVVIALEDADYKPDGPAGSLVASIHTFEGVARLRQAPRMLAGGYRRWHLEFPSFCSGDLASAPSMPPLAPQEYPAPPKPPVTVPTPASTAPGHTGILAASAAVARPEPSPSITASIPLLPPAPPSAGPASMPSLAHNPASSTFSATFTTPSSAPESVAGKAALVPTPTPTPTATATLQQPTVTVTTTSTPAASLPPPSTPVPALPSRRPPSPPAPASSAALPTTSATSALQPQAGPETLMSNGFPQPATDAAPAASMLAGPVAYPKTDPAVVTSTAAALSLALAPQTGAPTNTLPRPPVAAGPAAPASSGSMGHAPHTPYLRASSASAILSSLPPASEPAPPSYDAFVLGRDARSGFPSRTALPGPGVPVSAAPSLPALPPPMPARPPAPPQGPAGLSPAPAPTLPPAYAPSGAPTAFPQASPAFAAAPMPLQSPARASASAAPAGPAGMPTIPLYKPPLPSTPAPVPARLPARAPPAPPSAPHQAAAPPIDRSAKPATLNSGRMSAAMRAARLSSFAAVEGAPGPLACGLRNLGNTCFMSSVLQCMFSAVPLATYFVQGRHRNEMNRSNKLGTHGELTEEYAELVRAVWCQRYRVIAPRFFKATLDQYASQFVGSQQQDCQEFCSTLLDKVHEDLNRVHQITPFEEENYAGLSASEASDRAWAAYQRLNDSIIVDLFQGQLQTTIECSTCSHRSFKFNAFMFLSVPLPPGPGPVTLIDCLRMFCSRERLDSSNKWLCPRCGMHREAFMSTTISRLPPVLLIQLKRFSFNGPFRDKLTTHVRYPLTGLTLSSFISGPQPDQYSLFGVCNHTGTLSGGHYTAVCRHPYSQRWLRYDDSVVSLAEEHHVQSNAAYLLFYTRANFQAALPTFG